MAEKYSFAPAIKQPSIVPYLIRGPSAEQFLEDFNRTVDTQYGGNSNLKVLNLGKVDDVPTIVGSNPLILPIVNQMVAPARRVGRPEDLQRTLNDGDTLGIRGNHYIDLGQVLDFTGRHHEMALDVFNQLPANLRDVKNLPAVLVGYGLKNFDKGNYNLGLVVGTETQLRPAPILAEGDGRFSDADVSLETGLPAKLSGGDRRLWTAGQRKPSIDNLGLSWLYLDGNLDLDSSNGDLAYSFDSGRVVLF